MGIVIKAPVPAFHSILLIAKVIPFHFFVAPAALFDFVLAILFALNTILGRAQWKEIHHCKSVII